MLGAPHWLKLGTKTRIGPSMSPLSSLAFQKLTTNLRRQIAVELLPLPAGRSVVEEDAHCSVSVRGGRCPGRGGIARRQLMSFKTPREAQDLGHRTSTRTANTGASPQADCPQDRCQCCCRRHTAVSTTSFVKATEGSR